MAFLLGQFLTKQTRHKQLLLEKTQFRNFVSKSPYLKVSQIAYSWLLVLHYLDFALIRCIAYVLYYKGSILLFLSILFWPF